MSYIVSNWFIMNLFVFLLSLSFVSYINCLDPCNAFKTCGKCISEKCVWCSENKNVTGFRCNNKSYMESHIDWCKKDSVFHPIPKPGVDPIAVKQNYNFSSTVQFRPQELIIKASPGVDVKFDVFYRAAKNFPLDVYFLMDYTYTMKRHRTALMEQALDIYKGLTKMTNNVLLGVGSFVEKPGLPYTDTRITKNSTYSFKNHLKLTTDMKAFEQVINGSEFGSNYDDAEAGLDALMQVMKCKKEIGWRENTRRIIVLATDNTYHSAGDGKMLGAIKPNDMRCHLKDNVYRKEDSLKYDYPSVSAINKVAKEGNFLIIFAIAGSSDILNIYSILSAQILGSKHAVLTAESNILEIIESAYKESVNEIKISHEEPTDYFQVTIDQECSVKGERNCKITPEKEDLTIPVTITSTKCTTSGKPEVIKIKPLGLKEALKIKFDVVCQCECEKTKPIVTPENCNGKGVIQCGACKCNDKWGGEFCDVNCSDETGERLEIQCKATNSSKVCNEHGTCECGKCTCTDDFTGNVCEYDPNKCDTGTNGKICGGHGICVAEKCECERGWKGSACDCPVEEISLKLCTGPFSKKACSGRGVCNCGKCSCMKTGKEDERYLGEFCNQCKDCAIEECQKLEEYAKCNYNEKKDICDEKFHSVDKNIAVLVANRSELANRPEWPTGTQCRALLDDGTFLLFKFNIDTKTSLDIAHPQPSRLLLMIQREVEIPPKADLLVPIASAIAGIILIGLLTAVFWKVLVELYDKREYTKFCDEAKSQGFDVTRNPLYESPTQNFVNPGFNQNIQ